MSYGQWLAVYNALSFGIAGMGSATIFFWPQIPNMNRNFPVSLGGLPSSDAYRNVDWLLTVRPIVGIVATSEVVHLLRKLAKQPFGGGSDSLPPQCWVSLSGQPFNDAHNYVKCFWAVSLILVELTLVVELPVDGLALCRRLLDLHR